MDRTHTLLLLSPVMLLSTVCVCACSLVCVCVCVNTRGHLAQRLNSCSNKISHCVLSTSFHSVSFTLFSLHPSLSRPPSTQITVRREGKQMGVWGMEGCTCSRSCPPSLMAGGDKSLWLSVLSWWLGTGHTHTHTYTHTRKNKCTLICSHTHTLKHTKTHTGTNPGQDWAATAGA